MDIDLPVKDILKNRYYNYQIEIPTRERKVNADIGMMIYVDDINGDSVPNHSFNLEVCRGSTKLATIPLTTNENGSCQYSYRNVTTAGNYFFTIESDITTTVYVKVSEDAPTIGIEPYNPDEIFTSDMTEIIGKQNGSYCYISNQSMLHAQFCAIFDTMPTSGGYRNCLAWNPQFAYQPMYFTHTINAPATVGLNFQTGTSTNIGYVTNLLCSGDTSTGLWNVKVQFNKTFINAFNNQGQDDYALFVNLNVPVKKR